MKCEDFLGGQDVQRSLNLDDSKCVNIFPTTNDKGDVTGFYSTPGLAPYATAASIFTGIYTASNGRCFAVSGTTFYEITTGGVLTNRGTVTAGTVSRMTDNGIELMLVNGTDGWLFTFATNALKKISVLSSDFTVTIASPAVFSTVAAHGLVAGDVIRLTTTTANNTASGQLSNGVPSSLVTSNNAKSMIVSPDNMNAYYCTPDGLVYQFLRDSVGNLSPLSPPSYYSGLAQLQSLEMSPDGKFVYGCATINNYVGLIPVPEAHLVIFSRSLTTGILTFDSSINFGTTDLTTSSKITPDGLAMYVYTSAPTTLTGKIYQYSRNTATGHLTALTPATLTDVYNTDTQIVIPADGISLYLLSRSTNQVSCYSRNITTSLLTAIGLVSTGSSPFGIAITADKKFVYITNNLDNSISIFSRDLITGVLTLSTTVTLYGTAPISTPTNIIISPDDLSVYVGSETPVIFQFDRNATTGAIVAMTDKSFSLPVGSAHSNSLVITANSKSVYLLSTGTPSVICMLTRQVNAIGVGLPTGLATLTDYYVIATGLTANTFEVSLTAGGTAVNTTGVQAGTHTYHTIGYGFPNGAKTVSYIDGRFVACQPNTQNFFVSDVLKGGYWDALNVQTADSNPDYVVGQIVSHNELIVFCEQSGETFYDSGTYPSPFVRNVSGIFEVGCIAPYSIAKIDNSVMWLGKSNTGQGVVYRLNGYTPVRLSSYAIEYAMQTMSTISDAQAFTYQQEGHHFYVITFPTGGRTFAFDINTNLWHERQSVATTSASITWGNQIAATVANIAAVPTSVDKCVAFNGSIYCMLNPGSSVNYCYTSTDGITWIQRTMPSASVWTGVAWNGSVFCAIAYDTGTIAATSPDGITWTARTLPGTANWTSITFGNGVFLATGYAYLGGTIAASSPDGIAWTIRSSGLLLNQYSRTLWTGTQWIWWITAPTLNSYATSPDGITWTARTFPAATNYPSIGWNGTVFCLLQNSTSTYYTSSDGITWATRTFPIIPTNPTISALGSVFAMVQENGVSNVNYTSNDGINWSLITMAGAYQPFFQLINNGVNFVAFADTNSTTLTTVISSAPAFIYTYGAWEGREYTYFDNKHLVTDSVAGNIYYLDLNSFTDGTNIKKWIRSWRAPPSEMKRAIHHKLTLEFEAGVGNISAPNPQLSLKYSNDGGHTWSADNWRDVSMGTFGQYSKRVYWYRLGMTTGQTRLYELSSVSPTKVVLLNTYLE